MSRNLFSILSSLKFKWNNYYLIGLPLHCSYSYFTQKNRNIEVSEKYTFDSNGFTNFMIVDTENKHYKVSNNLWFWKWDSIEDWTVIKKGNKIPISYYGFRVPFLGIFPNVIDINYSNTNKNSSYSLSVEDIKDILKKPSASIGSCNTNALNTAVICAK
jgi:hypothetical protein